MQRRPPPTYDEITARTVPDLDSSWRPTPSQRQDTKDGLHVMDDGERALAAKVAEALRAHGLDVAFTVEGETVILQGSADAKALRSVEDIVLAVDGVDGIDNRMHVGA